MGGAGLLHELPCSEPTISMAVPLIQGSQRNPLPVGVKSGRVVSGPAEPFQGPRSRMSRTLPPPPVVCGWVAPFFSAGAGEVHLPLTLWDSANASPPTPAGRGEHRRRTTRSIGGDSGAASSSPARVSERVDFWSREVSRSVSSTSPLCRRGKGDSGVASGWPRGMRCVGVRSWLVAHTLSRSLKKKTLAQDVYTLRRGGNPTVCCFWGL